MTTIEKHMHTGIRGVFYVLKKISSFLFILCLGFLLCLLFWFAVQSKSLTKEDILSFIIIFVVALFASGLFWIVFRALHNAWVRRHLKQTKMDFLEQLHREGIITIDVLNQAKSKVNA